MQILVLQMRTVVVDLMFNVQRGLYAGLGRGQVYSLHHLYQRTVHEIHHRQHVLLLFSCKCLLAMHAVAVQRATEVIHRVADGLQLRNLP